MSVIEESISGWGRYPQSRAQVYRPQSLADCKAPLFANQTFIARGMGRSYGDSASAATVLHTQHLDHFVSFDAQSGLLSAEAGVSLREIIALTVPRGWFLPVTPGTSFVSLGGAIASDVHGKNHHVAGCFGQHVVSIDLLLGSGQRVTTSPSELPDLFYATCGGMGLTGVILSATIQLLAIPSAFVRQRTLKCRSLQAVCEALEENLSSTYSVAWIDCLATGSSLGRSVLILGEHAPEGEHAFSLKDPINIRVDAPNWLLGQTSMRLFNSLYYAKARHGSQSVAGLTPYFYPLDAIGHWNRLYGRTGFLQYQCVVPKADGYAHLRNILSQIVNSRMGSFLAVLKTLGPANRHPLSFPIEGYTLALDFKRTEQAIRLIRRLDNQIAHIGGRVYLTKDAVMQEVTFKAMYPRWQEFESLRERYHAVGRFASQQSVRLGLA